MLKRMYLIPWGNRNVPFFFFFPYHHFILCILSCIFILDFLLLLQWLTLEHFMPVEDVLDVQLRKGWEMGP